MIKEAEKVPEIMLEFKSEDLLLEDCSILNINQVIVQIGNTMLIKTKWRNVCLQIKLSRDCTQCLSSISSPSKFCWCQCFALKQHFTGNIKSEFIARGSDAIEIEEQ